MAILRAAATASDTLDATTYALVEGLTLTPAADDYFLYATIDAITASGAAGDEERYAVFVGNPATIVAHTVRSYLNNSSVNDSNITYCLTAKVSPGSGDTVEIRHESDSVNDPLIAAKREMTLFPMPAAGTEYEDSATGTTTVGDSTFITVPSMTRTPVSGDYLVTFSSSVTSATSGDAASFKIRVGGTDEDFSLREILWESSGADQELSIMLCASITANGSQAVDVQFNISNGSGTITCHDRTMNLIPVASADINQATSATPDTDSTTDDKLLEAMTITDPGADDYLVMHSMTHEVGTITSPAGLITLSIHEGGAVVTDSERDNEIENSLDGAYMLAYTGGRVTVGGATDDLELFWQGNSTDLRTSRERTFIAMRELGAATETASGTPSITKPTSAGSSMIKVVVTDVNTTEEWNDGATGLVITGSEFI